MSRRPHEPTAATRGQVKTLTAMGINELDVGRFFGISPPTLRKYYQAELETGHIEANATVAKSLYQLATHKTKPNPTACIFWLKCRAGWREDDIGGMGKKELADLMAKTAEKGTEWDNLLTPPAAAADK